MLKPGQLEWNSRLESTVPCSACGDSNRKLSVVAVANPLMAGNDLVFYRCDRCACLIPHPFQEPPYYADEKFEMYTKFYVELGAGISSMIGPLAALANEPWIRSFLDVGCGFGFTVDFARRQLGWDAHGIDPGSYGKMGAKLFRAPIVQELLGGGSRYDAKQFDLVFSSEVLEHVQAPTAFVKTLWKAVSPGGVLVLTTPSAEFINEGSWSERVLAALSPGYHAILFTATGLESLLRTSGFSDVRVVQREERLVAVAGKGRSVSKFNISRHPSDHYTKYLLKLIDSAAPDFLRCGAAFRLFEEHVNRGEERAASEAWRSLDRLLGQIYGAHPSLLDPGRIAEIVKLVKNFEEFGKQAPYCLSSILFLRGMQLLNWSGDFAEAARLFRSASEMIAIEIDKEQAWFIASARLYWIARLHQGIAELRGGRKRESIATFGAIVDAETAPAAQRPCSDRAQLLPSVVSRALKELGVAHLQVGDFETALAMFRRVLARPEEVANQGLHLEVRGLIDVAIATYRASIGQPRSRAQIGRRIRDRLREFDRWRRRLIRGR